MPETRSPKPGLWKDQSLRKPLLEVKADGAFVGFAGLAHQKDWPEGEHKTEVGRRLDRAF